MSASSRRNAEQKFWQNPELVEGFLKFLDPAATLQLALAHKKTRSILKGSWAWKCLVKRNSPLAEQDVDHLVAIMKLKKDARNHILDVLHSICETGPPPRIGYKSLQMGCPYHSEGHSVSLAEFLLLEKVEAAFGTTLLTVEDLHLAQCDRRILSILGSRFARQQKMVSSSNIGFITLDTKMDIENLLVLVQASPLTTIRYLDLSPRCLGGDGWRLLAEGLQNVSLGEVHAQKRDLESGSWNDLRVLWKALGHNGHLYVYTDRSSLYFAKDEGEASWISLCQMMDLTEGDWLQQQQECGEDDPAANDEHENNSEEDV